MPAARPKLPHLDLTERTALDEREAIIASPFGTALGRRRLVHGRRCRRQVRFLPQYPGLTAHDRLRSGLRLRRDHRLARSAKPLGRGGRCELGNGILPRPSRLAPGRAWHHQWAQPPSLGRWRKMQVSRSADPGLCAWRRDAAQARRRPARPPSGRHCSGQAPGTGWRASRSTRHSGSSRWAWFRSVRTCWDGKARRLLRRSGSHGSYICPRSCEVNPQGKTAEVLHWIHQHPTDWHLRAEQVRDRGSVIQARSRRHDIERILDSG